MNFKCVVTCYKTLASYMETKISVTIIAIQMFGYLTLNVRFRLLKSKFVVG